jgi:hypothetical protein
MKRPRNRTLPLTFEPYAKVVWLNYPDNIEKPHCLEYCGPHWENLLYDFFRNNEEIYQHIHSLETNLGMTAGAIEIHFKYDTPNELIENICNRAIQMMQSATQPIFVIGARAFFDTTQSDLIKYNGREVIIKRLLTEDECDIDEVGFMYEVETNGETFQAYQDELS